MKMFKFLSTALILSVISTYVLAEPGVHRIRIRFPGPITDNIVLPVKQEIAPYPAAGFKPEPEFELPEVTYLPPAEPEVVYGPAKEEVKDPAAQSAYGYEPPSDAYGPPSDTYGPPDNIYKPEASSNFQTANIVNAPLTAAVQFTPPRPINTVSFRPLRPTSANIVNAPLRLVSHLTLPRPQPAPAFRPKRPQVQAQQPYQKTQLTLPYVDRLVEFRPRRVPQKQQSHFFGRPLPSSIFGNSNNGPSGRQLPSKIFSN